MQRLYLYQDLALNVISKRDDFTFRKGYFFIQNVNIKTERGSAQRNFLGVRQNDFRLITDELVHLKTLNTVTPIVFITLQ